MSPTAFIFCYCFFQGGEERKKIEREIEWKRTEKSWVACAFTHYPTTMKYACGQIESFESLLFPHSLSLQMQFACTENSQYVEWSQSGRLCIYHSSKVTLDLNGSKAKGQTGKGKLNDGENG